MMEILVYLGYAVLTYMTADNWVEAFHKVHKMRFVDLSHLPWDWTDTMFMAVLLLLLLLLPAIDFLFLYLGLPQTSPAWLHLYDQAK